MEKRDMQGLRKELSRKEEEMKGLKPRHDQLHMEIAILRSAIEMMKEDNG